MNKKYLFALVALVGGLTLLGAGCASPSVSDESPVSSATHEQIKIAATIHPLFDIAKTVAGDDAEVIRIVSPGTSPHFFDPSPSLLRELQGTDAIFRIGAGLDDWANGVTANVSGAEVVDISTQVSLKKTAAPHLHEDGESLHGDEDEHNHDDHGHAHGEFDPHYWLDPVIAKDIAMSIAEELVRRDETNAAAYVQRANAFAAELAAKQNEWERTLAPVENKEIVTFHNAFGYFADHFGFRVVATFEPFAGKEPTPQYLVGLQEEITAHNISTLFLEPQMPGDVIEQFASDNNLSLGILDPLGGVAGREGYIDLIEYNVETLARVNK